MINCVSADAFLQATRKVDTPCFTLTHVFARQSLRRAPLLAGCLWKINGVPIVAYHPSNPILGIPRTDIAHTYQSNQRRHTYVGIYFVLPRACRAGESGFNDPDQVRQLKFGSHRMPMLEIWKTEVRIPKSWLDELLGSDEVNWSFSTSFSCMINTDALYPCAHYKLMRGLAAEEYNKLITDVGSHLIGYVRQYFDFDILLKSVMAGWNWQAYHIGANIQLRNLHLRSVSDGDGLDKFLRQLRCSIKSCYKCYIKVCFQFLGPQLWSGYCFFRFIPLCMEDNIIWRHSTIRSDFLCAKPSSRSESNALFKSMILPRLVTISSLPFLWLMDKIINS